VSKSVAARARGQRPLGSSIVGCAALGLYLVALVGVPIPQPKLPSGGAPFPCQDHPCGCRSAAQCWGECCCFSREEKLAWAARHNIQPPAALTATPASGCTSSGPHEALCCASERSGAASCCSHAKVAQDRRKSACCGLKSSRKRSPEGRSILLVTSANCRGLAMFWLHGGPAITPPVVSSPLFDGPSLDHPYSTCLPEYCHTSCPPVPPPRRELFA